MTKKKDRFDAKAAQRFANVVETVNEDGTVTETSDIEVPKGAEPVKKITANPNRKKKKKKRRQ